MKGKYKKFKENTGQGIDRGGRNFARDTEAIKRNQMEILELKRKEDM